MENNSKRIVEINGCLPKKNNRFQMKLTLIYSDGSTEIKWKTTGLPIKNNQRRAEQFMDDYIKQMLADEEARVQAEEIEKRRRAEEHRLEEEKKHSVPFVKYLLDWVKTKESKQEINENTAVGYESQINSRITEYFGCDIQLSEISAESIALFYLYLYGLGRTANTVHHYHTMFYSAISDACRAPLHLIDKNFMLDVDSPNYEVPPVQYYGEVHLKQYMLHVAGDVIEPAVILDIFYGFRRSELCALSWDIVDFRNDRITVRRKSTRTRKGNFTIKDSTKTKKSLRTLPLLKQIKTYLLRLYERQQHYKALFGDRYEDNNLIVCWPNGKPMRPDYITNRHRKLLAKFNMPHVKFHALRHSCATMLLMLGYTLEFIAEWLGHADIESTEMYAHLEVKSKLQMAESINQVFSLPVPGQDGSESPQPMAFLDAMELGIVQPLDIDSIDPISQGFLEGAEKEDNDSKPYSGTINIPKGLEHLLVDAVVDV